MSALMRSRLVACRSRSPPLPCGPVPLISRSLCRKTRAPSSASEPPEQSRPRPRMSMSLAMEMSPAAVMSMSAPSPQSSPLSAPRPRKSDLKRTLPPASTVDEAGVAGLARRPDISISPMVTDAGGGDVEKAATDIAAGEVDVAGHADVAVGRRGRGRRRLPAGRRQVEPAGDGDGRAGFDVQ